MAACTHL